MTAHIRCEQDHQQNFISVVSNSSDRLMEFLNAELDKNMDLFELYVVRNIIKLPYQFEEMREQTKQHPLESKDPLLKSGESELIVLDQNLNDGQFPFLLLPFSLRGEGGGWLRKSPQK